MARLPEVNVCIPEGPPFREYRPKVIFFGVWCGDICLITLKEPMSLLFDVFAMELDYLRWNVRYSLDLSPLSNLYPSMVLEERDRYNDWFRYKFSVLSYCVDEEREKPKLLISLPGKTISCDMNGMIVKEIADVVLESTRYEQKDLPRFRWLEALEHVETLAPV
ncbi:OLC1v1035681C1 [Oldenlandia corymbosa var. corymbosa]|uniref:OLC1v1035681C1 n=1 Tax=Oldenlandia corymbosa var. corymbosa TaxID=529605 RepID=A0AAV1CWQ4_OLDCO|nr:OLC1v1035681C1 [Oldenlandia corymbosa var. corymbosa]